MTSVAIDEFAADILLQSGDEDALSFASANRTNPHIGVCSFEQGTVRFVVSTITSTTELRDRRFVVVPDIGSKGFFGTELEDPEGAFRRVMRAALTRFHPGRYLPQSWAPYNSGPFTIFYMSTIKQGQQGESARAVLELGACRTRHALLALCEASGRSIDLEAFSTPTSASQILDVTVESIADLTLPAGALDSMPPHYRVGVELLTQAHQIAHAQSYDEWILSLSELQRQFVKEPINGPTTLRGAAGTGKSLALMLKAIHDCYVAIDAGRAPRVLILTHNWTSAEIARETIAKLDSRGGLLDEGRIAVRTLQSLAIEVLGLARLGLTPLSEDGYDGKKMQLELVEGLLAEFQNGDWALYRSRCSESFRRRIAAGRSSPDGLRLSWDLMDEFGCVISAEKGLTKESYVALPRTQWMMELPAAADREVAFLLYDRFRRSMHEDMKVLSMFDTVNDLLRHLDRTLGTFSAERTAMTSSWLTSFICSISRRVSFFGTYSATRGQRHTSR